MKTRILAAVVLIPVLLLIVLVAPKEVAAVVMGILMAIASYELLYRTKLVRRPRLVIYSSIMAFAISIWSCLEAVHAYFLLLLIVYFILLFAEIMMDHVKIRIEMIALCFVAGVIITIIPMVLGYIFARKICKLPLLSTLGSITGGMTSTPALGTLITVAGTDDVAGAYASTYPIALVLIVFACQIIGIVF